MIKSHNEKQLVETEVIDEIICNCCGEKIQKVEDSENMYYDFQDYITLIKDWGYFSKVIGDGEHHELHICESCYYDWIANFKIRPY